MKKRLLTSVVALFMTLITMAPAMAAFSIYPLSWSWASSDSRFEVVVEGMDYSHNFTKVEKIEINGNCPKDRDIYFDSMEDVSQYSREFDGVYQYETLCVDYSGHINSFGEHFIDRIRIDSEFYDYYDYTFEYEQKDCRVELGMNRSGTDTVKVDSIIVMYPDDYTPGKDYVLYNDDLVVPEQTWEDEEFRITYVIKTGFDSDYVEIGEIVALGKTWIEPVTYLEDVFVNHNRVHEEFWTTADGEAYATTETIQNTFGLKGVTSVSEACSQRGWKYVLANGQLWIDEDGARAVNVNFNGVRLYNPEHQAGYVKVNGSTKTYTPIRPPLEAAGFTVVGKNGMATATKGNLTMVFHYYGSMEERCRVDIDKNGYKSTYYMQFPCMNNGGKTAEMSYTEFAEALAFATGVPTYVDKDFSGPVAEVSIWHDYFYKGYITSNM